MGLFTGGAAAAGADDLDGVDPGLRRHARLLDGISDDEICEASRIGVRSILLALSFPVKRVKMVRCLLFACC